jgi:hypothetical protein
MQRPNKTSHQHKSFSLHHFFDQKLAPISVCITCKLFSCAHHLCVDANFCACIFQYAAGLVRASDRAAVPTCGCLYVRIICVLTPISAHAFSNTPQVSCAPATKRLCPHVVGYACRIASSCRGHVAALLRSKPNVQTPSHAETHEAEPQCLCVVAVAWKMAGTRSNLTRIS